MQIRNLQSCPEHLSTLATWHHTQWGYLYPGKTLEHRLERYKNYLTNSLIPTTWVALEEETLLGSASIVTNDLEIRPVLTPWLASVYVIPERRREGIASALVEHILRFRTTHNLGNLHLFTMDQVPLYRRLGFRALEVTQFCRKTITIMVHEAPLPKDKQGT